jgi:hypothetical protein
MLFQGLEHLILGTASVKQYWAIFRHEDLREKTRAGAQFYKLRQHLPAIFASNGDY